MRLIESLGVRIETGVKIGALDDLRQRFDAVFLAIGLGHTPALGIPGEELIIDGLDYIEQSKLDPAGMKIGHHVAVIGAGNTAIDCATIAKRLGAKRLGAKRLGTGRVTLVYRRTEEEMRAYPHELEFIRKEGVEFRFEMTPESVVIRHGEVTGLACQNGIIPADQIIKAIGQEKPSNFGLEIDRGFIRVSADLETSLAGVFAGGDCIRVKNVASTVMAVQDGKLAAAAIHRHLENTHG